MYIAFELIVMRITRSILVLFFLLAQAWQLQAAACAEDGETCGMACCAEMVVCDCTDAPTPVDPLGAPPSPELVSPFAWLNAQPVAMQFTPFQGQLSPLPRNEPVRARSTVSLVVLYHSFLN